MESAKYKEANTNSTQLNERVHESVNKGKDNGTARKKGKQKT
jgi:hypothetical protein